MPPLSKRKKQIKSLAKKKQNKSFVPLEHLDFDDSDSEWENEKKIIWEDVEFDQESETFVKVLLDRMKNCVTYSKEPEYEKYFNYEQLIISIENELKLVNYQEPKMKASLCITRQLNKGSYFACCLRKIVYIDGHERSDVIEYRLKFLEQMESYEKLMPKFKDNNLEIQINSDLQENEYLHIPVIHDETTFHSNDGRRSR
ncbi:18293_t:CDS:2 [Funneliformis geosporum]|uniref:18293_t:CDS:1 n=1 Tax=Funneliformis geosporum TaxID=1117311 RepID=A0A9W4T4P0_9GLOM|nr:18293_t:CDS:2 [Funneliformis geosporum]